MSRVPIKVVLRLRPLLTSEPSTEHILSLDGPTATITDLRTTAPTTTSFTYSGCLPPTTSQLDLYTQEIAQHVALVWEGKNSTTFAYGTTGSGKTHTLIGTTADDLGIIPRAVHNLLKERDKRGGGEITISFVEIKSKQRVEKCVDLLVKRKKGDKEKYLDIDDKGTVKGVTEVSIGTSEDFTSLFTTATARRATASTALNTSSSRSHAILTITVTSSSSRGKVTFIDLAGSENNTDAGNASGSDRMNEAIAINKSLLALSLVVKQLNEGLTAFFRGSKLTMLMKGVLGGDAAGLLICNVAPSAGYLMTEKTLRFGSDAQKVQNVVVARPPSPLKPTARSPRKQPFASTSTSFLSHPNSTPFLSEQLATKMADIEAKEAKFAKQEAEIAEREAKVAEREADLARLESDRAVVVVEETGPESMVDGEEIEVDRKGKGRVIEEPMEENVVESSGMIWDEEVSGYGCDGEVDVAEEPVRESVENAVVESLDEDMLRLPLPAVAPPPPRPSASSSGPKPKASNSHRILTQRTNTSTTNFRATHRELALRFERRGDDMHLWKAIAQWDLVLKRHPSDVEALERKSIALEAVSSAKPRLTIAQVEERRRTTGKASMGVWLPQPRGHRAPANVGNVGKVEKVKDKVKKVEEEKKLVGDERARLKGLVLELFNYGDRKWLVKDLKGVGAATAEKIINQIEDDGPLESLEKSCLSPKMLEKILLANTHLLA